MKRIHVSAVVGALVLSALASAAAAQGQFRELANRLPQSANALVLLNVEKILQSPMAVSNGWKEKMSKAFDEGMIRLPPKSLRFVLASQIDFEFMQPTWEAAVADFQEIPSLERIAQEYMGTPEKVGEVPAVALPSDVYVLQLGPKTLGAMSPANRQQVLRWVGQANDPSATPLSPYLVKGAGFSDEAGTEIIMAIDLQGAFSRQRIVDYLKDKEMLDKHKADRKELTKLLEGLDGIRAGVRIGEKPFAKITIDFDVDVSSTEPYAKDLFLEILGDGGMMINDLASWKCEVKGKEVSLQGYLSSTGLRQLLSVIDSPTPAPSATAGEAKPAAAPTLQDKGAATLAYFKSVEKLAEELKDNMGDMKTTGQAAVWFDKYARKIEKLPMLNVDGEMLDFGLFVAASLRSAAGGTRSLNAEKRMGQVQVSQSSASLPTATYGAGYGTGYYGNYNPAYYAGYGMSRVGASYAQHNAVRNEVRADMQRRSAVRTQARTETARGIQAVKGEITSAASEIRRKMTEKYQIQF